VSVRADTHPTLSLVFLVATELSRPFGHPPFFKGRDVKCPLFAKEGAGGVRKPKIFCAPLKICHNYHNLQLCPGVACAYGTSAEGRERHTHPAR
jgi:hypothetical protein